jgi:diguanylate cyclase (GGDEF)-like protein
MSIPILSFDAGTLLVIAFASSILMAAVLGFVFAGRFRDGLARWTQSLWVQALAWLLMGLRDVLPDTVTVAAAHGLLALGWSLQLAAVLEFQRRRVSSVLAWAPAMVVFALFYLLLEDARLRLIASGWLYGAFYALIAAAALAHREAYGLRAYGLFAGSYLLAAVVLFLRSIGAWIEPQGLAIVLAPQFHQILLYFVANALVVASSLAYLLMHRERADEETRRLATTDPLTGLFNRRTFIELAERELARSRRDSTPLSFMILDLDHFKQVNDTYGHLVGDEVLVAFTMLIRDCARRGDLVVRYGGEEFCVLLPATALSAAVALAERIRAATAATALTTRPMRITVSVGVTAYAGIQDVSLDTLLARADEALYRAKNEGRDRVVALPLADADVLKQRALPLDANGREELAPHQQRRVNRS